MSPDPLIPESPSEATATSPRSERSGSARQRRLLWSLVGLFVLARLLLNLAAPTQLYHSEEYVNLRLAAALLGDEQTWPVPPPEPAMPWFLGDIFDYQYQDFDGGTLVASFVLVPLAAVFGLGVFTMKTGALLWALATLLLWVAVGRRLFGVDGGLWMAVALLAAPAPWLIMSSIHWGNHAESAVFPPLVLLLLLMASDRKRWWTALLLAIAAGLLAGLGAWFSLLNLLPVALIAGLLPLVLGWRTLAALPLFVGATAVGFLPWLGRNHSLSPSGIGAQGTSLPDLLQSLGRPGATQGGAEVLAVWPRFAFWKLPGLWSWPEALQPAVDLLCRVGVAAGAVCGLVLSLVLLARGPDRLAARRRLFVLGVAIGSCLALPLLLDSAWEIQDRRLAPVYVFGQALLAIGLASLWRRPGLGRIASLVAAGLLLLPNIVGQVGLIASWDRPNDGLRPWLHFALPADHPRQRKEAGVPNLASHEVARFNRVLDELLRSSSNGGRNELRGFSLAFSSGGGGQGAGALHRYPPACPTLEMLDKAGPSSIYMEPQARALGMGLAIRCSDQPEDAISRCRWVQGGLAEACLEGLAEAPP